VKKALQAEALEVRREFSQIIGNGGDDVENK
jgi:hypothetical protein